MTLTVSEDCRHDDCLYRRMLNRVDGTEYCAYMMITGHSRGCPVSSCDKYVPRPKRRKAVMRNGYYEWEDDTDGGE